MPRRSLYVGVDVQLFRGCPMVAIDDAGRFVASTWIRRASIETMVERLRGTVLSLALHHQASVVVGIDAPRQPLPAPRRHYWQGGVQGRWRACRSSDRGCGRHCEVVVAALGLGRPQWTPRVEAAPAWMTLGFACFASLMTLDTDVDGLAAGQVVAHEAFPSASYVLFDKRPVHIDVSLAGFGGGPKDMLDAYCAAASVREVNQGRGWLAGGGDGFGAIALPGPALHRESRVHAWPLSPESCP